MKHSSIKRVLLSSVFILVLALTGKAQRYLSDYDSTLFIRDTVRPFVKRLENLHFSGYIQPQYQVAGREGAPSFEGGNFPQFSNNRFMLRRARMKIDYILPAREKNFPKALFTFQIDATERGVFVRDMFLRIFEPAKLNFSLTMGLFARPFGYEVNLSSSYREAPERGRMSQTLMPTERDLGAMLSYESQKPGRKKFQLKIDAGFFNGPGLSGTAEFDRYKDFISRITIKPVPISRKFIVSGGLSLLNGGWMQSTKYRYGFDRSAGMFEVDSTHYSEGAKLPKRYYGADVQLVFKQTHGKTEIRAEYWRGKQPGTATTTLNPGTLPAGPSYVREFDGAFFYFLQNIFSEDWELVVKYDWYDPNRNISGGGIGKPGANLTTADIKFHTIGTGITRYFTGNLKILAYYAFVRNEKTGLAGFTTDDKDDVFTLRMQLRF